MDESINTSMGGRIHSMLGLAARDLGLVSYTSLGEMKEEIAKQPQWIEAYGLEEIQIRDRVIHQLMQVAFRSQAFRDLPFDSGPVHDERAVALMAWCREQDALSRTLEQRAGDR